MTGPRWYETPAGRALARRIAYQLRRSIDLAREGSVAEAEVVLRALLAEVEQAPPIAAAARAHLRVRLEIGLAALRAGGVEDGIRALRLASLLTGLAA